MAQPTLLWVSMHSAAASAEAIKPFERHCRIRPIGPEHLWAAVAMATASDVICLDFDHPDLDGLKFAAATKTRFASVPIVMLTAQQSHQIMLWALRMRVFDVIIKPVAADDVARCVQRLEPIVAARRTQSVRRNATGIESIPVEARYRLREGARDKLRQVCDFIAKHYAETIGEIAMAKMCGMSPFRFSRAFRATYGVTFRDYLSEQRLSHAKRLLSNPQISVSDVAAMTGFDDPSYFARLFRKRTGTSPTAFRAALPAASVVSPLSPDDSAARPHSLRR
jgi:AraC-like DNA-binding protein/CheY-like chemotaxis protein